MIFDGPAISRLSLTLKNESIVVGGVNVIGKFVDASETYTNPALERVYDGGITVRNIG
jgi:hypothetical protein